MAKVTVTGTLVTNLQVRRNRGLNAAYALVDFRREGQKASLSNTVYVHMIPLPDRARIVDGWVKSGARTTGQYQVGLASTLSCFVAAQSMTASQMTRFNVNFGQQLSLTASDVNSYSTVVVSAINCTSASTTGTIAVCVFYSMD